MPTVEFHIGKFGGVFVYVAGGNFFFFPVYLRLLLLEVFSHHPRNYSHFSSGEGHHSMLLNRDFSPIEKKGLYPLGEIHVACFSLASPENNGNDPIYLFIPDIENSFRTTE